MSEDEKIAVSHDEKDQNCDCQFFIAVGTVHLSVVFSLGIDENDTYS